MPTVMDAEQIRRAIARIAHEIVEDDSPLDHLILMGIRSRGAPLAKRIAGMMQQITGRELFTAALDVTPYRDDLVVRPSVSNVSPLVANSVVANRSVILVDDVLYTGRTIRAAMDALVEMGRPTRIQLAVLVDRGHRELPIRPDYVGKNIPTSREQTIHVRLTESDGRDEVLLESVSESVERLA